MLVVTELPVPLVLSQLRQKQLTVAHNHDELMSEGCTFLFLHLLAPLL